MKTPLLLFLVSFAAFAARAAEPSVAMPFERQQLRIVGSSTVYPFVATAAEQFGRAPSAHASAFRTPIVEATGTGGGIKLFCEGIGESHPDIANASRAMKPTERAACAKAGIHNPLEIPIGFDGIVLANGKGNVSFHLTDAQIFLALAQQVPNAQSKLQPNPYHHWNEIDASLPHEPIEVYGPPPTSGTRDAFAEIAMEKGCKHFSAFVTAFPDEKMRNAQCRLLREDGRYVDAGENDNIIVQKLVSNPHALGIFGYSFLEENADKVQASTINATSPTFESIAAGKYALSRSLYVYAKREHLGRAAGLQEFLSELTGEDAAADEGYMAIKGLIPEPNTVREQNRAKVAKFGTAD